MGLLIGNVSNTILPERVKQAVSEDVPMYGVKFSSTSTVGVRTYDASTLNWGRSTNSVAGIDDFADLAPFNVKECCRIWDNTTNTASYVYKDNYSDTEWNQIRTGTHATISGDIMIEFPEFWYRRVATSSGLEIIVAPEYKAGFTPDPWHYSKGVHHEKRYITKYNLSSGYSSKSGVATITGTNINSFRTGLRSKGMELMSAPAWWSIGMLMLVKYATTDLQSVVSVGYSSGSSIRNTGNADSVRGLDGSSSSVSSVVAALTLGIENFYGNCWKVIDGCYEYGGYLYIKDVEDVVSIPSSLADLQATYTKINTSVQSGGNNTDVTSIANDSVYDWFLFPSTATGSKTIVCNDNFWSNNDSTVRCLILGSNTYDGSTVGLFCFCSNNDSASPNFADIGAMGIC